MQEITERMLLAVQGTVTPISSKSHISYCFTVPAGLEGVQIHFSYEPKELHDMEKSKSLITDSLGKYMLPDATSLAKQCWETYLPLKNLLTVSVDDPACHRGSAHRHDPVQEHIISHTKASPGFMKGDMIPELWTITISLHAVVTKECCYQLQVAEERMLD